MPQTRDNGGITPINADIFDPTVQLAAMVDSMSVITNVSSAAARDALVKFIGRTVRRMDTADKRLEVWNGSAWDKAFGTAYTPIWTGVTDFGTGGTLTGTYWLLGDRVFVRSKAKFGAAATIGNASIYCPLPTGYPIGGTEAGGLGTGFHVNTAGVLRPLVVYAGSSTTASVWSSQFPVQTLGTAGCTSAQNEFIEISFWYQTSGAVA